MVDGHNVHNLVEFSHTVAGEMWVPWILSRNDSCRRKSIPWTDSVYSYPFSKTQGRQRRHELAVLLRTRKDALAVSKGAG